MASDVFERRLLWHSLVVEGDTRVVDHLAALLPDARHPVPARRAAHYTVRATADGFTVAEEGDALTTVATAAEAADAIHVRGHRRAFELASLSGWARVHAATVDLATNVGRRVRVLVVGPSGAGKTTLATRLLLDGADVQGDESVLVRRGESLAVPRALHLKPGAARLLPDLDAVLPTLPVVGEVTVLDPARVDRPVTLHLAPVAHVVLLAGPPLAGPPRAEASEQRGAVTCTPVDGGAVLEALLVDAFPLTETKARMVSVLAGAMVSARGHRLTSGPPDAMVEALRGAIGRVTPIRQAGSNRGGTDVSEDFEAATEGLGDGRRSFLKKMAIGTAFTVPVVSSFTMAGIQAVYAQTPTASGRVSAGNATGSTTTSTSTTSTTTTIPSNQTEDTLPSE